MRAVLSDDEMNRCGSGGFTPRASFAAIPRRLLIDGGFPFPPPPNRDRERFLALRVLGQRERTPG